MRVSVPKGASIPSRGSEQPSVHSLSPVFPAGSGCWESRGSPPPGQTAAQGAGQLPHCQHCGVLNEAFSISIVLPALEMPTSLGSLCRARVWVPRGARSAVLPMTVGRKPGEKALCDLSRLANHRCRVPSPAPSSASTGRCLGRPQSCPGCPEDTQPARQQPRVGKSGTE